MTTSPMPTSGQYLSHWEAAKMEARAAAGREDLAMAFDNSRDPGESPTRRDFFNPGPGAKESLIHVSVGAAAINLGMAAIGVGAVAWTGAGIGALAFAAGWLASQAEERRAYNKAIDLHGSLLENTKNSASREEMIQAQRDIISTHRRDNEGSPQNLKDALGGRAVLLGVMACGVAAGAALVVVAPALAVVSIIGGVAGIGAIVGRAHGEVLGQEKTENMLLRIVERSKDFNNSIAARRQNEAEQESMEPARPKNSF